MEIFLGGLVLGLAFGWYFTKYKMVNQIQELTDLLQEQDELIKMKSMYIERMKRNGTITKG